jgi:cell division protein FtsB
MSKNVPRAFNKYVFLLILLLLLYLSFLNGSYFFHNLKLKREFLRLKQQIEQEKINFSQLSRLKEETNSDEYIEYLARTKLGLVKRGEEAYQIVGSGKN